MEVAHVRDNNGAVAEAHQCQLKYCGDEDQTEPRYGTFGDLELSEKIDEGADEKPQGHYEGHKGDVSADEGCSNCQEEKKSVKGAVECKNDTKKDGGPDTVGGGRIRESWGRGHGSILHASRVK